MAARRTAEGGAEVRVSDTGVGIDPASLPHVFEPFFTAFDVSKHSSGEFEFGRRGLGLGLSLVKGFVEMHGGTVSAASEPGAARPSRSRCRRPDSSFRETINRGHVGQGEKAAAPR